MYWKLTVTNRSLVVTFDSSWEYRIIAYILGCHLIGSISEIVRKLTELPERGTCPKELSALGIHEFREILFKPYRVICRVERRNVYIYLIADSRRDMQTLLSRRLLDTRRQPGNDDNRTDQAVAGHGEADRGRGWPDHLQYGLVESDVPALLDLVADEGRALLCCTSICANKSVVCLIQGFSSAQFKPSRSPAPGTPPH